MTGTTVAGGIVGSDEPPERRFGGRNESATPLPDVDNREPTARYQIGSLSLGGLTAFPA